MINREEFLSPERKYAPLQIVHDFEFLHWNTKDKFDDMSSMSIEEKEECIKNRLEDLKKKGFGGVILNVAFENYLENEQSWKMVGRAVDIALLLGLRVWIYDEQYYPSGSAGGMTLRDHPEYEAIVLSCVTCDVEAQKVEAPIRVHSPHGHSSLKYAFAVKYDKNGKLDFSTQINIISSKTASGGLCWDIPLGKWKVYCFFIRTQYEGAYVYRALRAPRRTIDFCNSDAVRRFLDVTYCGYFEALGENMNRIEGVFFDEPGMTGYQCYPSPEEKRIGPAIPSKINFYEPYDDNIPMYPFIHWSNDIDRKYKKIKGYSLVENLPALFEGGKEFRKLRIDYCDYISSQFGNSFVSQYKEYLEEYSITVGGHYRLIDVMGSHARVVGDVLRNLGLMDHPGCDRLAAKLEPCNELAEKLVSSAAHLYGNKLSLVEGSDMKKAYENLQLPQLLCSVATDFAQGINIIVSYYDETIFTVDEYKKFNTFVSRLGALLNDGVHCPQALLYYPFKQVADNTVIMNKKIDDYDSDCFYSYSSDILKKLALNLKNNMVDFDFINDECLLKSKVRNGKIYAPSGEEHTMLLLPDVEFLPEDVAETIKGFISEGIYVGVYGSKHDIEGLDGIDGIKFFNEDTMPASTDLVLERKCNSLRYIHKRFTDYELYLVVQTGGEELDVRCNIPYVYENITSLDLFDGIENRMNSTIKDDRMCFDISLKPYEAKIYMIHK